MNESRAGSLPVALAIVKNSMIRMDIASGLVTYALGVEGFEKDYPTDPFENELAEEDPSELLDRTHEDQLVETEAKIITMGKGTEPVSVGPGKKERPKIGRIQTHIELPRGPQNPSLNDAVQVLSKSVT